MKPSTFIAIVGLTATTAIATAAPNSFPTNTATATKPESSTENPEDTKNPTGAIDLTGGTLFSKLVKFTYNPSERDPFINASIVSPFVTEADLPELLTADKEKIQKATSDIEGYILSKIEILGISTEERISGYGVGNNGQILKPGRVLLVPADEQELESAKGKLMESGLDLAIRATSAGQPQANVITVDATQTAEGNFFLLETLRLEIQGEDKIVVFRSPVGAWGEDRNELKKIYEGTKNIPQVGEIMVEPR